MDSSFSQYVTEFLNNFLSFLRNDDIIEHPYYHGLRFVIVMNNIKDKLTMEDYISLLQRLLKLLELAEGKYDNLFDFGETEDSYFALLELIRLLIKTRENTYNYKYDYKELYQERKELQRIINETSDSFIDLMNDSEDAIDIITKLHKHQEQGDKPDFMELEDVNEIFIRLSYKI